MVCFRNFEKSTENGVWEWEMTESKSDWAWSFTIQILSLNAKVPAEIFFSLSYFAFDRLVPYLSKKAPFPLLGSTRCHLKINRLWVWCTSWHTQCLQNYELIFPQWDSDSSSPVPVAGKVCFISESSQWLTESVFWPHFSKSWKVETHLWGMTSCSKVYCILSGSLLRKKRVRQ